MSITITDPVLLGQLTAAPGFIELCGPDGRLIGTLFLKGYGVPPPGVKSPISDEEFEEARKETGGKPLSEILKRLQADGGK
jgi:hypothetical protein